MTKRSSLSTRRSVVETAPSPFHDWLFRVGSYSQPPLIVRGVDGGNLSATNTAEKLSETKGSGLRQESHVCARLLMASKAKPGPPPPHLLPKPREETPAEKNPLLGKSPSRSQHSCHPQDSSSRASSSTHTFRAVKARRSHTPTAGGKRCTTTPAKRLS